MTGGLFVCEDVPGCIVLDPLRFCSNLRYIDRHGKLEIETTKA